MKKIVSTFVKYPFYGKIIILILILMGTFSVMRMKKSTFPIVESRIINIMVAYPGATPVQIEEGITTVVEDAIRGIPGIKEFSSSSAENISTITITAIQGYDINELLSDVKNVVDGISNLPRSAERPIISKQRELDISMFMTLAKKDGDLLDLNDLAKKIEDDFMATGFISQITIFGLPSTLEISVEIDETQLQRYNISFDNIQNAISYNNLDILGGTIKNPREELLIVSRNRSSSADDIKNIVLKAGENGELITIGDVATVKRQFEVSPNTNYANRDRSVVFFIQKLKTEDLDQINNFIKDYVKKYNKQNSDSKLTIVADFSRMVGNQLNILISNGIMGIILVIFVLSLLLNIRLSLWVAWGIPASFLGMFILANLAGITINVVSLFGMILIIGILVDDGIVIGENIFTHYEKGKTPMRAAIDGTMEVLPAVFTSISTTIVAFMPLFFIEGNMQMMYEMGFVVVAALIFSIFEGMFVLPGHLSSARVLKPINKKSPYGKIRIVMDRFILYMRDKLYLPLLRKSLKYKFITLASVLALIIITVGVVASGVIPFTFFPNTNENTFVIDIALKPGVNEDITLKYLQEIEDIVWEVNNEFMEKGDDTISYITSTLVHVGHAFNASERGTHAGNIRLILNERINRTDVSSQDLKKVIAKRTSHFNELYKIAVGASDNFGAPISYSIVGYDIDKLNSAKDELIDELGKMTSLYNIVDNTQLGSQEVRLNLKPFAYSVGLTQASLMQQVRSAFFGGLSQRLQEGRNELWVYVRYPLSNRKNMGELENMKIITAKGVFPLKQLVDFKMDRNLNKINRYNGKREIRVEAYQKNPNEAIMPILSFIEDDIFPKIRKKYSNIDFIAQGQQKETKEEMEGLTISYTIAFVVIVLIIMIYFKSFSQGVIILSMIPLGFMGAIWGVGIHGQAISMMSIWGLVTLSGTIINDAIVFLSKYNANIVNGMKINDAVVDAGRKRFRAIVLTTVTTTAGLMPLIIINSPDAQMIIPMATALAYGILFGTFFILMLLPHFILMFNFMKRKLIKIFKNKTVTPEEIEVAMKNHKIELEI